MSASEPSEPSEPFADVAMGAAGPPIWLRTRVDGQPVRYAMAGSGPAAIFFHGWGLRPNSYHQTIRHMGMAGCRVYAPALPGFGGTAELPAKHRSFAGYSAWVGRFLDAVGVDSVALTAGHSFGGGVAASFVHDWPERSDVLLLVNAVGSPTWDASAQARTMAQRPVRSWIGSWGGDLLRSIRVIPAMAEDFIPNLIQNPIGMMRAGLFIRRADLVAEVRSIAARNTPVLVVWSDRDGLIPRSAFDELRNAAGVEGLVVGGSHAWPIADPAAFGDIAIRALVESGELMSRSSLRAV